MITADRLASLFRPSRIALVGASDKSTFSMLAYRNLVDFGFADHTYLVNRRGAVTHGQPTVTSCKEIGEPVIMASLPSVTMSALRGVAWWSEVTRDLAAPAAPQAQGRSQAGSLPTSQVPPPSFATASPMRCGGTELLVGVVRDPHGAWMVVVALGGVFVEAPQQPRPPPPSAGQPGRSDARWQPAGAWPCSRAPAAASPPHPDALAGAIAGPGPPRRGARRKPGVMGGQPAAGLRAAIEALDAVLTWTRKDVGVPDAHRFHRLCRALHTSSSSWQRRSRGWRPGDHAAPSAPRPPPPTPRPSLTPSSPGSTSRWRHRPRSRPARRQRSSPPPTRPTSSPACAPRSQTGTPRSSATCWPGRPASPRRAPEAPDQSEALAALSPDGALALLDVAFSHPSRAYRQRGSGTPPPGLVTRAKPEGVAVAALVGQPKHAVRQLTAGVDLLIAEATEVVFTWGRSPRWC